jgi:hypothetical protein
MFSAHKNLTALQNLTVTPVAFPCPDTNLKRAQMWKEKPELLAFLVGEIHSGQSSNQTLIIISNIYLGEDKGCLKSPMITVEASLSDPDYAFFNDIHCALILYALASDAAHQGVSTDVISQYLAEAKSRLESTTSPPSTSPFFAVRNDLIKTVTDDLNRLQKSNANP